jgi:hypothetical protein
MKYKYLKPAAVKAFIKSHGKRTSHEYLAALDRYLEYKLKQAVELHNGGKKTVDGAVGSYTLGLGQRPF